MTKEYDIGFVIIGCDDDCGYAYLYQPYNMYIISLPIYSIKKFSIYQPNSTDIVIIMPSTLSR